MMGSHALPKSTKMTIGRKKISLVTAAVPVGIEVAADTAITESMERTDLLEAAAADAVSIQENVTTMTVGTIWNMMKITDAAEIVVIMTMTAHIVTADAERSIPSAATEATVKAVVTTMTTIPTKIGAGPEAEMKDAIGGLPDIANTRAEDMPMSNRRKELCSDRRFLSCLLIPLGRPIATTAFARFMYEVIV